MRMSVNPYTHMAKAFHWRGVRYPSMTDFCRTHGLNECTVRSRLKRGITDDRLIARRVKP
ncbi:MAG: hypothetical protein JWO52_3477 [Gammaproteobacteria bacterium]|nr:hypothetical protein [Gammaproteobacteria bacterium]